MPGKDGIALLEEMRALGVTTPVVMISGQANVDMAVRATRLGAVDFLEKPLSTEKLLLTIENVLRCAPRGRKPRSAPARRHARNRLGERRACGA